MLFKFKKNYIIFILLIISNVSTKNNQKFYINDLIEINDQFFKKFQKKEIEGLIFRKFKSDRNYTIEKFVGEYVNNGKIGKWTRRWNNGEKKSVGYYKDSIKDGLWEEFNQSGEKYYQLYYENGTLIHLENMKNQRSAQNKSY